MSSSRSFSVQFHALPEELIPILKEVVGSSDLFVYAFFEQKWSESGPRPLTIVRIDTKDVKSIVQSHKVQAIAIALSPTDLSEATTYDYLSETPDALILRIGRSTPNMLQESVLTTKPQGPDAEQAIRRWHRISRKLKKILRSGAKIVNPNTGSSGFYKDHRYSDGAARAWASGVRIVANAGPNYWVLDGEKGN